MPMTDLSFATEDGSRGKEEREEEMKRVLSGEGCKW